jgi:hypothetical protein
MDTVRQEAKAQSTKKRFWKDYEPIEKMTLVMAVFAVIYSIITFGLYLIANRQLEGLKKDQRPWVKALGGQVNIAGNVMPEKTPVLNIPLHILDIGKTPAKNIRADFFIESVKNGNEPLLNKSSVLMQATTGIVFPLDIQDFPASYSLLQGDWEDWKEGRSFLVIYGHITYKDIYQTEHWTDYCQFSSPKAGGYTAKKCTDYNSADDN